jgi:hypothetical protein
MSIQMVKQVSLSQPWGLNRSSHKIEPLGSHCSHSCVNRTRRSYQPDARRPVFGHASPSTCPQDSMSFVRSQRSSWSPMHVKWRLDTPQSRPDTPVPHQTTRALTVSPNDWTRSSTRSAWGRLQRWSRGANPWPDALGARDQMCHRVRSSLRTLNRLCHRMSAMTGLTVYASGHSTVTESDF